MDFRPRVNSPQKIGSFEKNSIGISSTVPSDHERRTSKGSREPDSHRHTYLVLERQQPRDILSLKGLEFRTEYRSPYQKDAETKPREQSRDRAWDQVDRDHRRPKSDSKGSKTRAHSRGHQPLGDWSEYRSDQERKERAAELAEQEQRASSGSGKEKVRSKGL